MKYKLINKNTNGEHICEKIVIDGFDYYVNDDDIRIGDVVIHIDSKSVLKCDGFGESNGCKTLIYKDFSNGREVLLKYCKKVITTNNSTFDLPQFLNDIKKLAEEKWLILDQEKE